MDSEDYPEAAGRQRQERRDHAAVRAEVHDLRHDLLRVRKSGPAHPDRLPDGGHGGFRHHGRRGQLPAGPPHLAHGKRREHTLKSSSPAAGLKEIERILEDSDEPVTFTLGDKHILFSIGDALLVSRVLEGEFIDWRRVVPTNCGTVLTANVAELTSSIERVSLIISEKVKSPVRCVFGDNMADFRTANTIGSAHDTCSIAGNGGELEIGFNSRYLLDALRVIPSEEVTLELQNGLSPIRLHPVRQKI